MNPDPIFEILATSEYGAYAVSVDGTILFWNSGAQRILGYTEDKVVGRRCSEALSGLAEGSLTPECQTGCPSLRCLRAGQIPTTLNLQMLDASGNRKPVRVTPMVVGGAETDAPLLIHLLEDGSEPSGCGQVGASVWDELAQSGYYIVSDRAMADEDIADSPSLTPRELEVLRLLSLGRQVAEMSAEMHISHHTIRNHIRNIRRKLKASTRLDAVVHAIRLGILELE